MGIRDFIKGQLIDVIEFTTDDKSILAHKFDNQNKQIMMGAQLTVRPGQMAVFINEGEMADIFTEGRYELSTSNMPVLTKLRSWKYGFESPFKVDIYFISVDEKIAQPWGTPSKIPVKDPDFGMLRIGANGYYNYKVADPGSFIVKLVGTDREYSVDECRPQLNGVLTTSFTDFFGESKITLFDAYGNIQEFSDQIFIDVKDNFTAFGLELISFNLREIRVPEVVETAMDERASVAAMGGMDMYQRKQMTDATAEAAVNMSQREGGSGVAGLGMEMSMGTMMGGMMGGMMGQQQQQNQNQGQQQAQPQVAMVGCSKCQAQVPQGTKFCPNCGNNMSVPVGDACTNCQKTIPSGSKFCPHCGTAQAPEKVFCKECGNDLQPGAKFCGNCGTAQ